MFSGVRGSRGRRCQAGGCSPLLQAPLRSSWARRTRSVRCAGRSLPCPPAPWSPQTPQGHGISASFENTCQSLASASDLDTPFRVLRDALPFPSSFLEIPGVGEVAKVRAYSALSRAPSAALKVKRLLPQGRCQRCPWKRESPGGQQAGAGPMPQGPF